MPAPFVHLRSHSDFSFSWGVSKVPDIVKHALTLNQPAIALTDLDTMAGALTFADAAKKAGIQPIQGCQIRVRDEEFGIEGRILLLAKSEEGWRNISRALKLAHALHDEALKEYPWLEMADLLPLGQEVIALTGAADGILTAAISEKEGEVARTVLEKLQSGFDDRLYVEICRNGLPDDDAFAIEQKALHLALALDIPIVGTTQAYYTVPKRHNAWEVLRAVEEKKKVTANAGGVIRQEPRNFHLRTSDEMAEVFSDIPEAIENTVRIAQRCSLVLSGRDPILPPYSTKGGRSEPEELAAKSKEGLAVRLDEQEIPTEERQAYWERLDYELSVINKMGFPGYFLIVADFIEYAHSQEIPVGPGRGSGAGSVVAWALKITDLNPLQFGLLFERFLNPERVSMPDFDIDFCQDRRDEVIRYVQEKYGEAQVSAIATYTGVKSKTAIKDVGRVLIHEDEGDFSFNELNALTKGFPSKPNSADAVSIAEALEADEELRTKVANTPKYRILFELAQEVEGLYRGSGLHAAGIIIGGQALDTLAPVGRDKDGFPVVQYDMKSAEKSGLVKFDFLGLKTLSVIKRAEKYISETDGSAPDTSKISIIDPPVYQMYAEGRTNGVFQFESEGMKNALRSIAPDRMEDLIAINSLYRPGPMDQIPVFARRKAGKEQVHYPTPAEETRIFLEETFGILVYQEQVMRLAQVVAGYSLGGADLLRRAMGKKIREEMEKERKKFVSGALQNNITEKEANYLFEHIEKFAGYGFNKSHAAAYSMVSYRTAWLKHYYPVHFFSALLSYEDKTDRMALIKRDMEEQGIALLPPDVNRSVMDFSPQSDAETGEMGVRFGLSKIKSLSGSTLEPMLQERDQNGPFTSVVDFAQRTRGIFNKTQFDTLCEVGALDSLDSNRRRSAASISHILAQKPKDDKTDDLFGGSSPIQLPNEVMELPDWGDRIQREFSAVGFFFNVHPLDAYKKRLQIAGVQPQSDWLRLMATSRRGEMKVRLAGLVTKTLRKTTKNGQPYQRLILAEKEGEIRVDFMSRNTDLDALGNFLRGAQDSKRPVIVEAEIAGDVSLMNGEISAEVFTKGVRALDIDLALRNVRGNVQLRMDPQAIVPTMTEATKLENAADPTERRKVFESMQVRKLNELRKVLQTFANEQHGHAISLIIPKDGEEFEIALGKVTVSDELAAILSSMDGISSIVEDFSAEDIESTSSSRQAPSHNPKRTSNSATPAPAPAPGSMFG